jgi:hypothetical protein
MAERVCLHHLPYHLFDVNIISSFYIVCIYG